MPLVAKAEDAPAPSDAERTKIETVVHDYLMKHPEVIIQAVQTYEDRLQVERDKAAHEALSKRASDLLRDPKSQSIGNPQGDVSVVEFFDYQCPYCKADEPELQKLLKDDGGVRLVLKEFPVLGPDSVTASKAALASVKQGKYAALHEALLARKGHLDSAAIDDVAKSVGLDLDALHKDMEGPEIADEITQNRDLAASLDIRGTPGFVIGGQILPGASSLDELKKAVADARAKKS